MTEADRARRLVESCQLPGYTDPEDHEIYPAIEDGVNSIGNALAAAQVLATLAVADELRRSNEDRALFYTAMREFFEKVTEDPMASPKGDERCAAMRGHSSWDQCVNPGGHHGLHVDEVGIAFSEDVGSPVGSGQPAAAPECPVCGGNLSDGDPHANAVLTREQWRAHSEDFATRLERVGANRLDAALWGEKTAVNHFGPCPEES